MKKYDLVILGDLVADIIIPIPKLPLRANEHDWADGIFTELGGGCTTVVAARRLDLKVATLGVVGADSYGEQVTAMLAAEGVDVSHVAAMPNRQTVICVVVTDKAGQHVFLGIKDHLPPDRSPADWGDVVAQTRSLFTSGYTLRDLLHPDDALNLIYLANQLQVPFFFDPGPSIEFIPRDLLERVMRVTNVLLLTEEEAAFLVSEQGAEAATALLAFGPPVVVLKAGKDGCYLAHVEGVIHHPGFNVDVVDTVGAGDSFVAAFIAAYLRGGNWQECAAVANAMGAAVVNSQGAGRNVPPIERLARLLDGDAASRLLYPREG